MTVATATLTRSAGLTAIAAGAIFIGVQLNHAQLDAAAVTTTDWLVRSSLKALMAVLAMLGITGMYLHQVKKMGTLGLVGYLLFAANYLIIFGTSFVAAIVLPAIADTSPTYVANVLVAASGHHPAGDVGSLYTVLLLGGLLYVSGGLLFGIALYRARVLPRWAAALLAIGGLAAAGLSLMPDPWFRLLAFPNGIAMIALGYALWRISATQSTESTQSTETETFPAAAAIPRVAPVGVQ